MRSSKKAFTLIELLVVIAIIALLVSILLPSLNRAKALAKKTVCLSQVKSIGMCVLMYADANNDCLTPVIAQYDTTTPQGQIPRHHWFNLLSEYAGEKTSQTYSTSSSGTRYYEFSDLFKGCPSGFVRPPAQVGEWNPGSGFVWMLHQLNNTPLPANAYSIYWNYFSEGSTLAGARFYKRGEFSDATRRGWFGESNGWHIGGGPNTTDDPDNYVYPTWCTPTDSSGYFLGNDPTRHEDASNIWFIDGHVKEYGYKVGGNAFFDISQLPF